MNKILSACWEKLPGEYKGVYVEYVRHKCKADCDSKMCYVEDTRGAREHKNKKQKRQDN